MKGFLSESGEFERFLELDHLTVMLAQPQYLLAYEAALQVIARFYPLERFPQKALYALENLLPR